MWRVSFQNTISIWKEKVFQDSILISSCLWVLLALSLSLMLFQWWTPHFTLFLLWHWHMCCTKHLFALWDTVCVYTHTHTHSTESGCICMLHLDLESGAHKSWLLSFLSCVAMTLPPSLPQSPRLLRDSHMLLSPSDKPTPFLLLFPLLTPPRIFVCLSHHLQQQSVALFFSSLSPSSLVLHVAVVADRQFLTIEVSRATLFMSLTS